MELDCTDTTNNKSKATECSERLNHQEISRLLSNYDIFIDQDKLKKSFDEHEYDKQQLIINLCDGYQNNNIDHILLTDILSNELNYNQYDEQQKIFDILVHEFITKQEINKENFLKILSNLISKNTENVIVDECVDIAKNNNLSFSTFDEQQPEFKNSTEFVNLFESTGNFKNKDWTKIYLVIRDWKTSTVYNQDDMEYTEENIECKQSLISTAFNCKLGKQQETAYQSIPIMDEDEEEEESVIYSVSLHENTKNLITSKTGENTKETFQIQFMIHSQNKLKSTMDKLNKLIIDPNEFNKHYTMDIIMDVLYILSLITTILCLIQLYNRYIWFFYAILTLYIIGTIMNIIRSFFISTEVIKDYLQSKSKLCRITVFLCNILICAMIQPIINPHWFRHRGNIAHRLDWSWMYFVFTSLPQSIIMMILVLMDDNIYFISSLVSSILSTLFMLWFLFEPNSWVLPIPPKTKMGNSFIWYVVGFMMDYFAIFFIIIAVYYDSNNFVFEYYLYNALLGVPIIALHFAYHVKRATEEEEDLKNASKIYCITFYLLMYLLFVAMYLLFLCMGEGFCFTVINIGYNEYKRDLIEDGTDWNLLTWIVHNNCFFDFINYFNYKDKMKRLCIVNGLSLDLHLIESKDYEVSDVEEMKQVKHYWLENCRNNFENVSFKQLNQWTVPPDIKKIADSEWFYETDDISNYMMIFRLFSIGLYFISRINRYICFPIVITIYFSISNQYNIAVFIMLIIQYLFIFIGLIIIWMMFHEIFYSIYVIPGDDNLNELVRQRIGYYYNTMSIHQLHDLLTTYYFPTCISNVIVSFSRPLSMEELIKDEKSILDKQLRHIQNINNLSEQQFNALLRLLPSRYQLRFIKSDKNFTSFVNTQQFKLFIYKMVEDEAKNMLFNKYVDETNND